MGKAEVHSIHVHPVKAFRGQALREALIEPWGPEGDRRWALVDDGGKVVTQRRHPRLALAAAELLPGGVRLSAPGMAPLTVPVPDPAVSAAARADVFGAQVRGVLAGEAAHVWCSAYLDASVRLLHMDDPAVVRPVDPEYALPGETVSFADGYPLLLTSLASLEALNAAVAEGDRPEEGPLPMNRFRPNLVVDGFDAWAEDGWNRLAVGGVHLRVARNCGRCVVTTTDQQSARRGREPLLTLGRLRRSGSRLLFGQYLVPLTTGTVRVGDPVTVLE